MADNKVVTALGSPASSSDKIKIALRHCRKPQQLFFQQELETDKIFRRVLLSFPFD